MPRALFALLLLTPLAFAADEPKKDEPKKDEVSPFFTSWAKQKPGTSVTFKIVQNYGDKSEETVGTLKLAEVKEKEGVIAFDSEYKRTVDGKEEGKGTQKMEVKKSDPAPDMFSLPMDPKTGKPKDATEEGTEKVKVGNTEFECKWYKLDLDMLGGEKPDVKVWMSDTFPGGMVKITAKVGKNTQSTTATDVTIKK